jgi:hypothetical protein
MPCTQFRIFQPLSEKVLVTLFNVGAFQVSYVIVSAAWLMISAVMLKRSIFGRVAAYAGIMASATAIGAVALEHTPRRRRKNEPTLLEGPLASLGFVGYSVKSERGSLDPLPPSSSLFVHDSRRLFMGHPHDLGPLRRCPEGSPGHPQLAFSRDILHRRHLRPRERKRGPPRKCGIGLNLVRDSFLEVDRGS